MEHYKVNEIGVNLLLNRFRSNVYTIENRLNFVRL